MTLDEYQNRFKAQIVKRLTAAGSTWTEKEARGAAEAELEGWSEDNDGLQDDPESDADEALSYWEADE